MKTKIKIKNEFQNPNLIFGNEIQNENQNWNGGSKKWLSKWIM